MVSYAANLIPCQFLIFSRIFFNSVSSLLDHSTVLHNQSNVNFCNKKRLQSSFFNLFYLGKKSWVLFLSTHTQVNQSPIKKLFDFITAKIILERLGIQTSPSFVKIWSVCIPEFKAKLLFFGVHMACFFFI